MNKVVCCMQRTIHVWWFELRYILFSSRFLVLSIISFLLVHFYLKEILEFARDYDLGVYPAAIPILFSDGTFACLGILLVIFMISVFPVVNHLQQNVLIQSGCRVWCNAQMLTIFSVVFIWLAELQFFVCILIGRQLDFSGWGKVWGSCSSGICMELGYQSAVSVPKEILMAYGPGKALLMSLLFVFLMGVLFGEFIFCVDGICQNSIGEILLSAWSLSYLVIANFKGFDSIRILQKFSPKNWLSIRRYIGYTEGFREALLLMCGLILLMYIVNHLLVKKKMIMIK